MKLEKLFRGQTRVFDKGLINAEVAATDCAWAIAFSEAWEDAVGLFSILPAEVIKELPRVLKGVRRLGYVYMPPYIGGCPEMLLSDIRRRWKRLEEILTPWLESQFPGISEEIRNVPVPAIHPDAEDRYYVPEPLPKNGPRPEGEKGAE